MQYHCAADVFIPFPGGAREIGQTSQLVGILRSISSVCYFKGVVNELEQYLKHIICLIDHFTVVDSVTWPLNGSEAAGDLVLIQIHCLCCVNQVVFRLTRCIYMTKAEGSVSKQVHLQPRCYSKARSLNRQLQNGLLGSWKSYCSTKTIQYICSFLFSLLIWLFSASQTINSHQGRDSVQNS